jgi:hypothetical protein
MLEAHSWTEEVQARTGMPDDCIPHPERSSIDAACAGDEGAQAQLVALAGVAQAIATAYLERWVRSEVLARSGLVLPPGLDVCEMTTRTHEAAFAGVALLGRHGIADAETARLGSECRARTRRLARVLPRPLAQRVVTARPRVALAAAVRVPRSARAPRRVGARPVARDAGAGSDEDGGDPPLPPGVRIRVGVHRDLVVLDVGGVVYPLAEAAALALLEGLVAALAARRRS